MRASMVLVDTSVFVSHFRGKNDPVLNDLLLNEQVLLSNYVRLELLQGIRKSEVRELIHVLGGLEQIEIQDKIFSESENILRHMRGSGLALGIVDLLLAAEANLLKCPIYSLDKIFEKMAKLKLVAVL